MVAERKQTKGLALVTGIAIPEKNLIPEPLNLTGNVISDIFRTSGLSDNEIARAIGVEVEDLFKLSSPDSVDSVSELNRELAHHFLSVNIAFASNYSTDKVRELWRSEMLEYWEGVKTIYARVYQDRPTVQTEEQPQQPKTD